MMGKKRNNVIYCFVVYVLIGCNPVANNDERLFIKKTTSVFNVKCDSITIWLNKKEVLNQNTVYKQIGLKEKLILNPADGSKEILITLNKKNHKINRADLNVGDNKLCSIYYLSNFEILLFLEIDSENPFIPIYISTNSQYKDLFCDIISDTSFILNQLKYSGTIKFIPPKLE